MAQLTCNGRVFQQYWAGVEVVGGAGSEVTQVVKVLSTKGRYLCADCWQFRQHERKELQAVLGQLYFQINLGNSTTKSLVKHTTDLRKTRMQREMKVLRLQNL